MAQIDISRSAPEVITDGQDSITLTVFASDSSNAALEEATINISATAGRISTAQVVTDASGTATLTFDAGAEKANQIATITASSGATPPASIPVAISGTTLSLTSDKTSVLSGGGDTISLTGGALDADNIPISGKTLALSSSAGNTLTGVDANGDSISGPLISLVTDDDGKVTAGFAGNASGLDTLTLSGLGTQDALDITVTNAQFGFTTPPENTVVPVGTSLALTVTWLDNAGVPVTGKPVTFAPSNGTLSSNSATTNLNGQATVTYTASTIAAPATITVENGALQDSLTLDIRSITPDRVDLQAAPSVIPVSLGALTSTSTITATVRDSSNNSVAGVSVNFGLIAGPGGGEFLSPVSAVTNSAGQATTTFTSGGSVSAQNGVRVQATVVLADPNDDSVTSDATLTIGQQAANIRFGTSNNIAKVSSNGLEIGYALPITLLVTDNNSNPIIGQKINLGLYPLRFRTGTWDDTADDASAITVTGQYPNEDVNRNGILDPGEDGTTNEIAPFDTSYINGILDPGSVAQIPAEVTTDDNGLAAFNIVYPKSSAVWVDVELQASTLVSGSEASATTEETLQRMKGDLNLINSPFN